MGPHHLENAVKRVKLQVTSLHQNYLMYTNTLRSADKDDGAAGYEA